MMPETKETILLVDWQREKSKIKKRFEEDVPITEKNKEKKLER